MRQNQSTRSMTALRTAVVAAAVSMTVLAVPYASADTYPDRPITVVVPFDTGGYNDRLARAFQPYLAEELGQPVEIVNRPGAGTVIGNTFFVNQPADGYTLMVTSATPYIPMSLLLQEPNYSADDFHMINLPSRDATLAATSADSELQSWSDVIAALKEDPQAISIGVQPGSADFINMALAFEAEGLDYNEMRVVTYSGGGPLRTAAAGSQVDLAFVGAQGFIPLMSEITPLVLFADEAMASFEDTQLITEYGAENGMELEFVAGSQRGWVVHSDFVENHPDRYEILLGAIERATKNPEGVADLTNQSLATTWAGPEASNRAYVNTSRLMEQYADLLRQ